jgi:hypothetical protein
MHNACDESAERYLLSAAVPVLLGHCCEFEMLWSHLRIVISHGRLPFAPCAPSKSKDDLKSTLRCPVPNVMPPPRATAVVFPHTMPPLLLRCTISASGRCARFGCGHVECTREPSLSIERIIVVGIATRQDGPAAGFRRQQGGDGIIHLGCPHTFSPDTRDMLGNLVGTRC